MQFVNSIHGAAAVQVAVDEVAPAGGLISEQLIEYVGKAYQFTVKPQIIPGVAPGFMLPYTFQSGQAAFEDGRFPIFQLVILADGDIISAATTEIADRILDDYVHRMDADLGYRYASARTIRRIHQSHVVVDFENGIAGEIAKLGKIEALLSEQLKKPRATLKLRRLAFGSAPPIQPGAAMTLQAFENTDFLIERREGSLPVENRYYSAAPTTTANHIQLLERLESEIRDSKRRV